MTRAGAPGRADGHAARMAGARQLFSIGERYSSAELDGAYRRLALRLHPDKGGRADLFETARWCHEALRAEAEASGMWRPEVAAALEASRAARGAEGAPTAPRGPPGAPGSFDVASFNRRFEESRAPVASRDNGYADWLRTAAGEFREASEPALPVKSGADAFNRAFERMTPALDPERGALIQHPGAVTAGGLPGCFVDESEDVGDYTTEVGGLVGADCRAAHGSQRLASAAWARPLRPVERASAASREIFHGGGGAAAERDMLGAMSVAGGFLARPGPRP